MRILGLYWKKLNLDLHDIPKMNAFRRLQNFKAGDCIQHKISKEYYKYLGPIRNTTTGEVTVAYEQPDAMSTYHGKFTDPEVTMYHRSEEIFLQEFLPQEDNQTFGEN